MKVLFIVYHDIPTEARSQEIIEVCNLIGQTSVISYSKSNIDIKGKSLVTGNGEKKYKSFIKEAIKEIKSNRYFYDIIVLHDNYTACLIPIIKKFSPNSYICYDSSELYIEKKNAVSIKVKVADNLLRYLERKNLNKANLILAANKERAEIMKDYFNLPSNPVIFDNIHRIDDEYDEQELEDKYSKFMDKDKFNIIYAGGIGEKRRTLELVKSVYELGDKFNLLIIGHKINKDYVLFNDFIKKHNVKNVKYLGFVPRNELKYLLNKCAISVSLFTEETLNVKYCASGKVYESLFEGTPVLLSENPPFKRLCLEHKVGISTKNLKEGIESLYQDYSEYKKNVHEFIRNLSYESRLDSLRDEILFDYNKFKSNMFFEVQQ